ncbi:peroxiredoxin [Neisseria sp. Ec49-e6-T10]|uniref:peroxiredoxin n=1 Tax=Neisseria sp. Ec49-e6-T10 TaxID=3140744 RepID=UPI003EBE3046
MTQVQFTLPSTSDLSFTLTEHLPCVVYFYPKDNTPGCTNESIAFRDHFQAFSDLGVTIVGISRDGLKSHENFKAKFNLPFELLSDTDETVCKQFDVMKMKNLYGKQVMGVERSTFFIDASAQIALQWRKVKVDGHVEEVFKAVSDLLKTS